MPHPKARPADEILAAVNIIRIAAKTEDFRKWLGDYHKLSDVTDLYGGYRFFILVAIRYLMDVVYKDSSLCLEEDEISPRLDFHGHPNLEDVPASCEKIIFLRNIWNSCKQIAHSKSWEKIHVGTIFAGLFKTFDEIYDSCEYRPAKYKKEDVLKSATMYNLYLLFNDTYRGHPKASIQSLVKIDKEPVYLEHSFKGYSYALEYVWFILLGKEEFERFSIKDIHRAIEIHPEIMAEHDDVIDTQEEVPFDLDTVLVDALTEDEGSEQPNDILTDDFEIQDEAEASKWNALDALFQKIQVEIIHPRESQGLIDDKLMLGQFDKSVLHELLDKKRAGKPDYLGKDDRISIIKQLDLKLRWYKLSYFDGCDGAYAFNAGFALITLLLGAVTLRRHLREKRPIELKVFKHPAYEEDDELKGYDYSAAIFMDRNYGLGDSSGWLVIHDWYADYSHSDHEYYEEYEKFVQKYTESRELAIDEFIVDKDIFKEYLDQRSTSHDARNLAIIKKVASDIISESKGFTLEYLCYKWINETKSYEYTRCDFKSNSRQVDCAGFKGSMIDVYECKIDFHYEEIAGTIDQIKKTKDALLKQYKDHNINSHVVIYRKISDEAKKHFQNADITVVDDFRNILISQHVEFDKSRLETIVDNDFPLNDENEWSFFYKYRLKQQRKQ